MMSGKDENVKLECGHITINYNRIKIKEEMSKFFFFLYLNFDIIEFEGSDIDGY